MNPNNPPDNDNRVAIPDNREDNAEPILAFPSISMNGPNLQNAPLLPAGSSLTSPAGSQGSLNVNIRQPRNLQVSEYTTTHSLTCYQRLFQT